MRKYIVYSDGASRNFDKNTRRVGVTYSVILQELFDGSTVVVDEVSGIIPEGTNNRSEMLGPLIAIDEILEKDKGKKKITIYTDSDYVVQNYKYLFKKFFSKDMKSFYFEYPNSDLWEVIAERKLNNNIEIKWIRGHSGNPYNEYCDFMCNAIYRGEIKPTYKLK